MLLEVTRCGEFESGAQTPRNPIGRPGTNGNRFRRKQAFLGFLDAGNMNPRPKHLETPLVDREPMKIEFVGNKLSWGFSMRETWIRRPNTSKPHWSTGKQWKSSSPETCFPGVSRCGKHESGAQIPRKPIGRLGTNGNRVRGKTLPILDWKNNLRPVFTSHKRGGL